MTKKQTKASYQGDPGDEHIEKVAKVVEAPKPKKVENKKPTWEVKDRTYVLTRNMEPISYMLKGSDIYYFDEEKGYERELKYCIQKTKELLL